MPDLPGMKAGHLTCRSQYGIELNSTCFCNPYVQNTILDILDEAIKRFEPNGIVFDTVDIHPQRSRGTGKPIDIACFCNYCQEQMQNQKFDPAVLVQRVGPLSLVLSATDSGIRFITPKSHFSPEQLVDIAIKDEFVKQDDEKTLSWAQTILSYIKVRSKVTGTAIGALRDRIKSISSQLPVVTITNSPSFDWTGGVDLQGLAGQVDEVWTDIDDLTPAAVPPGIEILAYSVDRSRYRIDAFFEFASDRRFLERSMQTDTASVNVIERITERANLLGTANNLNKTLVNSFRKLDFIKGFVGIPYEKKIFQDIVQSIQEQSRLFRPEDEHQVPKVPLELVRKYIGALVQYREQGNELNTREIVGFAAQMNLIE